MIIQSLDGETTAYSLFSTDKDANSTFQAELRSNAEAFLSKRLIVCEGKTEIGFVRSMDSFLYNSIGLRIAHHGIGVADGGGQSIFKCAKILKNCGYDICLLMDSDLPDEEEEKNIMRENNVSVFDWNQGNALEEQVFYDATMTAVDALINIAVDEKGEDSVKPKLDNNGIPYSISVDKLIIPPIDAETRKKIGTIAKNKKSEWFKRIDLGEQLGNVMFSEWEHISETSKLKFVVNELTEWIKNHDN